jgi:hypothetical protein
MPPTKPGAKNCDDIKLLFAALSMTATLGLWNVFAANNQQTVVQATEIQPVALSASQPQPAMPGKILLGGQAPSQNIVTVQNNTGRASSNKARHPAPVATTRSS